MTRQNLKYAALSTYRTTVFIRRAGGYRFELSLPIDLPGHLSEDASCPLCFLLSRPKLLRVFRLLCGKGRSAHCAIDG